MKRVMSALVLFALLMGCGNGTPMQKTESPISETAPSLTTEEKLAAPRKQKTRRKQKAKTDIAHFRWGDTFEEVRDAVEKHHGQVLELDTSWISKNEIGVAEQDVAVPLKNLQWFNVDLSKDVDHNPTDGAFPLGVWYDPELGPMVKMCYVFEQKTPDEPYRLYYVSMHLVGHTSMRKIERFFNLTREKHGEPTFGTSGKTRIGMANYNYHDYVWETERSVILQQLLQMSGLQVDWIYCEK